ncbi:olfactory receptor 11A1-like [Mastacembelus armatus]|uniref:olfactory receptor 11A1-like n=1 Tax=Mastacembelus armatus TaxID=205130 RepID=UPI000E45F660|nr:olfactory receptor 11A1-like [Mastacembelus armatus]
MDNNLNVTYLTLDGYVEVHKYRYLYFVIMFTAYFLIICFNSIIVCLIVIHKNLHEPMYIFIAALLLNSVLLSTALYPKILFDVLSEKQIISYPACLFQWFIYFSLGYSEFLLLAAMAYDRYVSICKPLQYRTIMTKRNICILLVVAWILPACQFAAPVVISSNIKLCNFNYKGIICSSSLLKLHCVTSRVLYIYGLVVLINLLILPVLFILFTYIRIFIIKYQSGREVRRKAAQTCLPHLIVLINYSCLFGFDVLIARMETNFPTTVHLIMSLQVLLYHPLFNPIIYGLKMKEISKHLRKLFCPGKIV